MSLKLRTLYLALVAVLIPTHLRRFGDAANAQTQPLGMICSSSALSAAVVAGGTQQGNLGLLHSYVIKNYGAPDVDQMSTVVLAMKYKTGTLHVTSHRDGSLNILCIH